MTDDRNPLPPSALRGIVFDLDGTVADTLPVCIAAFRAAFRTFTGRDFSESEIAALFGPSEEGMCRRVAGDANAERCVDEYIRRYKQYHDLCESPFDGILPLLDDLRAGGVRVAIVSGKGARSAEVSLRRVGLKGHFDTVATGSPEGSIKPQAIRDIIGRWDIAPSEAAYVGDSPSDMHDARTAGVLPLAAAWAPTASADALAAAKPAMLFTSVAALADWLRPNAEK